VSTKGERSLTPGGGVKRQTIHTVTDSVEKKERNQQKQDKITDGRRDGWALHTPQEKVATEKEKKQEKGNVLSFKSEK